MKRTSSLAIFLLFICATSSAAPTTYRQPHPLAWMHGLPTGEMPGWNENFWFDLEFSLANVWNAPHTMIDKRNGNTLEYFADYEQATAIMELGWAIYPRLSFAIELPYAYRDGGELDNIIDDFHILIGNRRFNRQFYDYNVYNYSVKTNGTDYYNDEPLRGLANVKAKFKFWLLKWMGREKGSCPCGVSLSAQAKVPTQDTKFAGTTGNPDYYYLLHIGVPLFQSSAMWFTSAYSYLSENPAIKDWPVNRRYFMYEAAFDFALTKKVGILLFGRAESPFLDRKDLSYEDPSPSPTIVARNRAASGWNSLVYWRGSNGLGLRYRMSPSSQINLLFAEDWGIGDNDASDEVYSNGAPDANFVMQAKFDF